MCECKVASGTSLDFLIFPDILDICKILLENKILLSRNHLHIFKVDQIGLNLGKTFALNVETQTILLANLLNVRLTGWHWIIKVCYDLISSKLFTIC
jgi:hypothetical protein